MGFIKRFIFKNVILFYLPFYFTFPVPPDLRRSFRILPCSNHSTKSSNDNFPAKHSSRFLPVSSDHCKNSPCVIFFARVRGLKRLYAFLCASNIGFSDTFFSYRNVAPISLHFLLLSPHSLSQYSASTRRLGIKNRSQFLHVFMNISYHFII